MHPRSVLPFILLTACTSGGKSPDTAATPVAFSAAASANAIPDSEATTKPELIKVPERRYPSSLERKNISGTAEYRFVITEACVVDPSTIQVLNASAPAFASAGARMVAETRFSPGELNGKPVRVRVTQRVRWNGGSDTECQWTGGTDLLPPKCIPPAGKDSS